MQLPPGDANCKAKYWSPEGYLTTRGAAKAFGDDVKRIDKYALARIIKQSATIALAIAFNMLHFRRIPTNPSQVELMVLEFPCSIARQSIGQLRL
jgi:hypothetical protein